MPIYEYECESCGHRTEAIQQLDDPPLTTCESCGGNLQKLISAPAFQFKGTGWYVTDYADKGKGGGNGKEPAADGAGGAETSGEPAVAGEGKEGGGGTTGKDAGGSSSPAESGSGD
ncbi:MAG: FmdB family zinc ribbon protein [Thermoanaerobaculia bacterium]|nr:FmdB family zinc ribbon protein [Thermoanaerobaculia bacterium]